MNSLNKIFLKNTQKAKLFREAYLYSLFIQAYREYMAKYYSFLKGQDSEVILILRIAPKNKILLTFKIKHKYLLMNLKTQESLLKSYFQEKLSKKKIFVNPNLELNFR